MKNLEKLNVREMNTDEITRTVGGNAYWAAAAITFAYNVFGDWEENVASFKAGMAAA